MPRVQRHQQEALWEFVHTELAYINKLIITKDVMYRTYSAAIVLGVRAEKGFSTGCLTLYCLCFLQLVIAALVNLHRNGFLLEVGLLYCCSLTASLQTVGLINILVLFCFVF